MIRSVNSNFVYDYAVWKYPNLFKRDELALDHGFYFVWCSVCVDRFYFPNCKEVDAHVKVHIDEGNDKYCGH